MACRYGGVDYSEGSIMCQNGKEVVCRGVNWVETGYTCVNSNELPIRATDDGKYIRISPNGRTIEIVSPNILGCVVFTFPSHPGGMRIYNGCNDCKSVDISWSNGDITTVILQGREFKDLEVRASAALIVGENPC